jgi:hypothetical protein
MGKGKGNGKTTTLVSPEQQEQQKKEMEKVQLLEQLLQNTPDGGATASVHKFLSVELEQARSKLAKAEIAPDAQLQKLLQRRQGVQKNIDKKKADLQRLTEAVNRTKAELLELLRTSQQLSSEISVFKENLGDDMEVANTGLKRSLESEEDGEDGPELGLGVDDLI